MKAPAATATAWLSGRSEQKSDTAPASIQYLKAGKLRAPPSQDPDVHENSKFRRSQLGIGQDHSAASFGCQWIAAFLLRPGAGDENRKVAQLLFKNCTPLAPVLTKCR
jgi:hypothetical protein